MSVGDSITIERNGEAGWEPYYRAPLIQSNKHRSSELYDAGGEYDRETVDFRLRWHPLLEDIEFDSPRYRLAWRGRRYDIRQYDDYMYQHRSVTLRCVSHG